MAKGIVVLNSGSTSVKFAAYRGGLWLFSASHNPRDTNEPSLATLDGVKIDGAAAQKLD